MSRYSKDRSVRSISIGAAIAASSPAENANTTPANNGTVTGAGDEFVYVAGEGQAHQRPIAVVWDIRTRGVGTYTARQVFLEASVNGSDWDVVDTSNSTTGESRTAQVGGYVMFRARIGTLTVNTGAPVTEVGITV